MPEIVRPFAYWNILLLLITIGFFVWALIRDDTAFVIYTTVVGLSMLVMGAVGLFYSPKKK